MPLSFGLNVTKKPAASAAARPTLRKPVSLLGSLSDSEEEEEEDPPRKQADPEVRSTIVNSFSSSNDVKKCASQDGLHTSDTRSALPDRANAPPKVKPKHKGTVVGPSLSATVSTRKVIQDAEQQDASIFDYDAHYDNSSSAAQAAQRRAASQQEARARIPKYMTGMKVAATQRQRDYIRAEDKRLQRERELDPEGGDKEAFVTEAYKARQEEARKLEQEEKAKEEVEQSRRDKGGMGGFWRGVMDEDDKRRSDLVQRSADDNEQVVQELDKERAMADRARAMNEQGASIQINEEGVVADKRQLLKGGLNIASKSTGANSVPEKNRQQTHRSEDGRANWDSKEKRDERRAMGERHTRMMEHQMEEAKKRKAEEDAIEMQKREMASKSKKTDKDVSSAKERFLQRKKEAEERKRLGLED